MQLTVDDRVRVNDDVVFRTIEDEAVLLHLERGLYFGLDPIGTRVWDALVAHGSARPIISELLDEFDVVPETLESDVARLLNELRENDLIKEDA
jgi:hypothetical protein